MGGAVASSSCPGLAYPPPPPLKGSLSPGRYVVDQSCTCKKLQEHLPQAPATARAPAPPRPQRGSHGGSPFLLPAPCKRKRGTICFGSLDTPADDVAHALMCQPVGHGNGPQRLTPRDGPDDLSIAAGGGQASRELGSVGRIYLVVASADSRGWLLRHTDGRDGGRTRGHFCGLRLGLDDRHGGPMTSPCLDDRRVSGKARS